MKQAGAAGQHRESVMWAATLRVWRSASMMTSLEGTGCLFDFPEFKRPASNGYHSNRSDATELSLNHGLLGPTTHTNPSFRDWV